MTPPQLPQEIIDKIIDQFSETARWKKDGPPNKRVLASLSMVARAWRGRSQKHLFSIINFPKLPPTNIAETDFYELHPVFSLTRDLDIDGYWMALLQFEPTTIAFFSGFRNLEFLSLTNWYLGRFSAEQLSNYFGHLGKTVSHLKLEGNASSESLIYLTSMLPRLLLLEISITPCLDGEAGGTISREELPTMGSFQGCLYLWGLSKQQNDFLVFLSSASPTFDTICIDSCETGDGVGKLLGSSAASLESLELYVDGEDLGGEFQNSGGPDSVLTFCHPVNPISLSEFTQLREVCISHPWPESTASLLQTICSSYLKKFMVHFRLWSYGRVIRAEDADMWMKADSELREAYDLWIEHVLGTIEVTFRVPGVERSGYSLEGYQSDLKRFFPQFTEKVAVAIVC